MLYHVQMTGTGTSSYQEEHLGVRGGAGAVYPLAPKTASKVKMRRKKHECGEGSVVGARRPSIVVNEAIESDVGGRI